MQKADIGHNLLGGSTAAPKGIVDPAGAARRIRLARYPCSSALAVFADFFWVVEWDMRNRPDEIQRTLPFPNCHLVFDQGQTAIHGVVRGAFDRVITGHGKVLGLRFRPGGLRPLIGRPVNSITGRTLPLDGLLGTDIATAERLVLDQATDADMIEAAESILAPILPMSDPRAQLAEQAIAVAAAENGPTSVAALVGKLNTTERSLQRLFGDYVGVSPKWVIQRFRLQEAMARLAGPTLPPLADLAQELGFFDQAHFSTAFAKLVGKTPHEYRLMQTVGG